MKSEREDRALKKAIQELPEVSPSDRLWAGIEEGLDTADHNARVPVKKWLRYAAALVLVASVAAIWLSVATEKSNGLSYGEEVTTLRADGFVPEEGNVGFNEFLETECSDYRELCQKPEFKQLISQLTEVEVEVTNIGLMIETTGYDEFLYKAKAKADEETVRIKKELVKLLRG